MLRASIGFFVFGFIAFILGFYGIGGLSIELGKILLIAFVFLAVISLIVALITGRKVTRIPPD